MEELSWQAEVWRSASCFLLQTFPYTMPFLLLCLLLKLIYFCFLWTPWLALNSDPSFSTCVPPCLTIIKILGVERKILSYFLKFSSLYMNSFNDRKFMTSRLSMLFVDVIIRMFFLWDLTFLPRSKPVVAAPHSMPRTEEWCVGRNHMTCKLY